MNEGDPDKNEMGGGINTICFHYFGFYCQVRSSRQRKLTKHHRTSMLFGATCLTSALKSNFALCNLEPYLPARAVVGIPHQVTWPSLGLAASTSQPQWLCGFAPVYPRGSARPLMSRKLITEHCLL